MERSLTPSHKASPPNPTPPHRPTPHPAGMLKPLGLLLWGLLALQGGEAYDNGVGALPQMGLNSWNSVGGGVSEAWARAAADALVSSGLRDAGYVYVCLGASLPWTAGRPPRAC